MSDLGKTVQGEEGVKLSDHLKNMLENPAFKKDVDDLSGELKKLYVPGVTHSAIQDQTKTLIDQYIAKKLGDTSIPMPKFNWEKSAKELDNNLEYAFEPDEDTEIAVEPTIKSTIKPKTDELTSTKEPKEYLTEGSPTQLSGDMMACTFCQRYYAEDMFDPEDLMDDGMMDMLSCWHCFFWMNYEPKLRSQCDGVKSGMTIANYILKCRNNHVTAQCKRKTNIGGCFLCEHLEGFPIVDIIDGHKINKGEAPSGSTALKTVSKPKVPEITVNDDDELSMLDLCYDGKKIVI